MKISLVVPVFNEETTIPIFYKTVREFEELKSYEVEIVFINDGSRDATESLINALAQSDSLVVPCHSPVILAKSLHCSQGLTMPRGCCNSDRCRSAGPCRSHPTSHREMAGWRRYGAG